MTKHDEDPRIDAVEMKRSIQAKLLEQTAGMTPEQEREFYQRLAEQLPRWRRMRESAEQAS